jgi:hypothetical protein
MLTDRGFVEFNPQRRADSLGIRTWGIGQVHFRFRISN